MCAIMHKLSLHKCYTYVTFRVSLDDTYDVATGEKLSSGQISTFIVGSGGFKGKRTSTFAIPTVDPPTRKPDITVKQKTSDDQVKEKNILIRYIFVSKTRIYVLNNTLKEINNINKLQNWNAILKSNLVIMFTFTIK